MLFSNKKLMSVHITYEYRISFFVCCENVMNIGEGVRYEVLDDALKQLSVRERYVIFARVVDMRGFAEIGTKLGLGYQGAAAVYYRAIRKIKKFIVESEKGGEVSR